MGNSDGIEKKENRNECIDYIKGLAILGIVIHHLISRYLNIPSTNFIGKIITNGSNLLGGVETESSSFAPDLDFIFHILKIDSGIQIS